MSQRFEQLTFADAMKWWPHRPILRFSPEGSIHETAWALNSRSLRPDREFAGLMLLYGPSGDVAARSSYHALLETNARSVRVAFLPDNQAAYYRPLPDSVTKPVVVRGHPARLFEVRRPQGNVDFMSISWEEGARGGRLLWEVASDPVQYAQDQLIAFTNSLDSQT